MAQKLIKVKTPLTTNGTDPVMQDGRQVYSESILVISAKATLEKRNAQLPQHLKVIIEDYDGQVGVRPDNEQEIVLPPAPVQPIVNKKATANATA